MNFAAAMSGGIYAILGVLHLIYTLHDFGGRPRYFRPLDRSLLPAMRNTNTAIAPTGRDYWSGVLGFNLRAIAAPATPMPQAVASPKRVQNFRLPLKAIRRYSCL